VTGDYDDILRRRDFLAVAPKKFPDQSFDPAPDNGLPHFGTDRNAEPAFSIIIGFTENHEMGGLNPSPPTRHPQKL
jgi:hypothetical protein